MKRGIQVSVSWILVAIGVAGCGLGKLDYGNGQVPVASPSGTSTSSQSAQSTQEKFQSWTNLNAQVTSLGNTTSTPSTTSGTDLAKLQACETAFETALTAANCPTAKTFDIKNALPDCTQSDLIPAAIQTCFDNKTPPDKCAALQQSPLPTPSPSAVCKTEEDALKAKMDAAMANCDIAKAKAAGTTAMSCMSAVAGSGT